MSKVKMRLRDEACHGDMHRYKLRRTCGYHLGGRPNFVTYVGQKRLCISLGFDGMVDS